MLIFPYTCLCTLLTGARLHTVSKDRIALQIKINRASECAPQVSIIEHKMALLFIALKTKNSARSVSAINSVTLQKN